MAVLGTGVQARAHAQLVPRVRPVHEIRIAGRRPAAVRALVEELRTEGGPEIVAAGDYAEAVDGADIVCAATHADAPVMRRAWLADGAHVNSVGYNPAGGEVDPETVAGARVFVETREAALAPFPSGAADLREAIAAGLLDAAHIAGEIGEVVTGAVSGRRTATEITLYRSVGVAVQDAAAAGLVLEAARREGSQGAPHLMRTRVRLVRYDLGDGEGGGR